MIAENDPTGGGLDPGNLFLVRSRDGGKMIEFSMSPAGLNTTLVVHRQLALNLAGWLVEIAGGEDSDFEDVRRSIRRR